MKIFNKKIITNLLAGILLPSSLFISITHAGVGSSKGFSDLDAFTSSGTWEEPELIIVDFESDGLLTKSAAKGFLPSASDTPPQRLDQEAESLMSQAGTEEKSAGAVIKSAQGYPNLAKHGLLDDGDDTGDENALGDDLEDLGGL